MNKETSPKISQNWDLLKSKFHFSSKRKHTIEPGFTVNVYHYQRSVNSLGFSEPPYSERHIQNPIKYLRWSFLRK